MIVVGGWPGRNVIGLNGRFGVRPAGFAVGGSFDNPLLNDADPGDDTTEFVLVVASLPASGTVVLDDTGGFEHTGAADGTHITTATLYTWAQGGPLTTHSPAESITSTFGAGGTTATIAGAGGIPSAEAVGAPALLVTGGGAVGAISGAGGIASEEALGLPTLAAAGGGTVGSVTAAGGISSQESVGSPVLASTFAPVVPVRGKYYASEHQFIREFGLEETVQLLADEERLLTGRLLLDALADAWTGSPSAEERAAAVEALARFTRKLVTVSNFMDTFLRAAVTLPLADGDANAGTLGDCCLALARCGLADDSDNATERMSKIYDRWVSWLKDVAAGRVQLVGVTGQTVPGVGKVRSGQARSSFAWSRFGGMQ